MDMWARAAKFGNSWYGAFKTPGRRCRFVCENGKPVRFDDKASAIQAAADVMCRVFMDTTTGWRAQKVSAARSKAEKVFRKLTDA